MRRPLRELARCLAVWLACLALAATAAAAGQDSPVLAHKADLQRVVAESGATVTVVNYWATWCPPCRAELPELKRLQKRYDPSRVRVIGVSFDYDKAMLERFLERSPLGYPNYIADNGLMGELGLAVIPRTVIFGPGGKRVSVHQGRVTAAGLSSGIDRLLEKEE